MPGTNIGTAFVQIVPSAEGIGAGIANQLQPAAKSAGTQAGTTVSKNMGKQISAVGKKFVAAGAIATAVSAPIIKGIQDALSAYEVQQSAETKLTEIYKTRMGASEDAAKSTMELASALQKQGIIGDEVALSGAQQLATFANYPGTINTLLPAMENLLAQQKGVNATSEDAVNIGNLMGKVLQGQTGALKRVGVSFTEAQEEVLKYGTEEEKAAMLSEVITSNVGNMNSELAKTPAGQMAQLSNTLGDIKEELGRALAPVVAQLANYISEKIVPMIERMVSFIQDNPIIAKIAVAIAGLLAVGGPLLAMLGGVMMMAQTIGPAFSALLGPVGLVIAAIAAAVAIGIALYKNWDTIKAKASAIWEAIKKAITGKITELVTTVKALFIALKNALVAAWNTIKETASNIWTGIKNAVVGLANAIKNGVVKAATSIKNGVVKAFTAVVNALKTIGKGIFDFITAPYRQAWALIKKIAGKIKSVFNFDFKLPDIKLPHFVVNPPGWKIGDLLHGSIPSLDIQWYSKGGIMTRPTMFGGGEAGAEGIIPLDPFWNRMDAMADSIVGGVATIAAAGAGGYGETHLDVYLYPNGPKMMEETVNMYDKGKKMLGK